MDKIDLDRGVWHRRTSEGIDVFMYVDTPGVFLNRHGGIVDDELASRAGFDVGALSVAKRRQQVMAAAMADIEMQFGSEAVREIKAERAGYSLVHIGLNRFNIEAPGGEKLNPRPLTDVEATAIFDQLVPPEPVPHLPLKGGTKHEEE